MSDDWDTGADKAEAPGDKFNQYDPMSAIGGPPSSPKVVGGAKPKQRVIPIGRPKAQVSLGSSSSAAPAGKPPLAPGGAPKVKGGDEDSKRFSARVQNGKIKPAGTGTAFTEKLDAESLEFFNKIADSSFSEQGQAFLNAYWAEVGTQAEFIFSIAWEMIKYADMHAKGVQYIHLYEEGNDLDFNIGLYFYEKLCKKVLDDDEGAKWRDDPKYAMSMPEMQTAIVRKQEIREKVDVNFDGKISFLEYLLYQYREFANPADFTQRAMRVEEVTEDNPDLIAARKALEEVSRAIRAYEAEKQRLEKESQGSGVKALGAGHQLAALNSSPLAENLNTALIKAEAAVRICSRAGKRTGSVFVKDPGQREAKPTDGSLWWMSRELASANMKYGKGGGGRGRR